MSKLSVYLVKGPINSYVEAIEAIEKLQPIEKVKSFNLHIKGSAPSATDPHQVRLVRDLGARPAIHTQNHGFYSTVKLSPNVTSIVATLDLGMSEEKLICVLSECDIIAVDVDIDQYQEVFEEAIPIQAKNAYPWARLNDILEA